MNNILLLCGYYYSSSNANGVCEHNIAKELRKKGYKVYTVSYSIENISINDANSIVIRVGLIKRILDYLSNHSDIVFFSILHKIIAMIRRIIIAPFFPKVPSYAKIRYYNSVIDIIKRKKIDTVIAFYKPFDTLECAYKAKRLFKNKLMVFTYHLDLLTVSENGNNLIGKYKEYKAKKFVLKELKTVDHIFLPCSEEHKYKYSNVSYVDFPLFEESSESIPSGVEFKTNGINLVYIGTLDLTNRNPEFFLKVIQRANTILDKPIYLHIWGDVPNEMRIFNDNVLFHGKIDHKYVMDINRKCDFLVNIGNFTTYQWIPSKIFQLFSTGEPIINIVRHQSDASQHYFELYDNSCDIYEFENDIDSAVNRFVKYISANLDCLPKNTGNLFERSKPSYFVSEVEKYRNGE